MTLSTQLITMLAMIGMGSYFGASLDTYQRFLQRSKRKRWLVFCNDILFWLMQALSVFYVLFLVNKGELRLYVFFALLCGFAAYESLMKKVYLWILELVISFIISIYRLLIKIVNLFIYKPISYIVLAVISILLFMGQGLLALAKLSWKLLLLIIKIALKPFHWLIIVLLYLLPKKVKKRVEKIYNRFAGFVIQNTSKFKNMIIKWFKK